MPAPMSTVCSSSVSGASKARCDALRDRRAQRSVSPSRSSTRELVAAEARDQVAVAHRVLRQALGDARQQQVAEAVAEHVVDVLEAVEVEHHHRTPRLSRRRRRLDRLAHGVAELRAVRQAGQAVPVGELEDLLPACSATLMRMRSNDCASSPISSSPLQAAQRRGVVAGAEPLGGAGRPRSGVVTRRAVNTLPSAEHGEAQQRDGQQRELQVARQRARRRRPTATPAPARPRAVAAPPRLSALDAHAQLFALRDDRRSSARPGALPRPARQAAGLRRRQAGERGRPGVVSGALRASSVRSSADRLCMSAASCASSGKPISTQPTTTGAFTGTSTTWCGRPASSAMALAWPERPPARPVRGHRNEIARGWLGAGRAQLEVGRQQRRFGGADARAVVGQRRHDASRRRRSSSASRKP